MDIIWLGPNYATTFNIFSMTTDYNIIKNTH
jgi:hypothetical protein